MRIFVVPISTLIIAFLLLGPLRAQSEVIDLPDVVRADTGIVAIAVDSSDSVIAARGRRAFALHGGFHVVATEKASLTLRLEPLGPTSVELSLLSKQAGSQGHEETLVGNNLQHAVDLACDRVVERTLGTKGFFAGKLSFVAKQRGVPEIYTSDLLFSQVRPLTADRALVMGPSWSSDGTRLLFTSYYKSGFPDIYLLDLSAGMRKVIANFKGSNNGASFSPDGRRIAMTLSGSGNSELYVANQEGRNLRRLTRNRSLETSPSWSPDGQRLVYASDAPGRPQLYVLPAAGGTPRRLPTNVSRYCAEPDWNPVDAKQIAFTAAVSGGFQIALYDAEAGVAKVLTKAPGAAVEPTWLNDGRHLIFTQRLDGRTRLMLLDSRSGKVSALHTRALGDTSEATFVYGSS
jgi:TolB protein